VVPGTRWDKVSSDDEFLVYSYGGGIFKEMGRLSRWPMFPGNGIIYVDDWMGFWSKTSKYVQTNQRVLKQVPQEFYAVNQEGTVRESFALLTSRTDNTIMTSLKQGSRIVVGPAKLLQRIKALTEFKINAIHLSYCILALCPFKTKYIEAVEKNFPDISVISGTHEEHITYGEFQNRVENLFCQPKKTMVDVILNRD